MITCTPWTFQHAHPELSSMLRCFCNVQEQITCKSTLVYSSFATTAVCARMLSPNRLSLVSALFFMKQEGLTPTDYIILKKKKTKGSIQKSSRNKKGKVKNKVNYTSVSIHSVMKAFHLVFARRITRANSFLKLWRHLSEDGGMPLKMRSFLCIQMLQ